MKVIDFMVKGNVFCLYIGKDDDQEYWGDDWDDRPYEHNAGTVYHEYQEMRIEFAVRTSCLVLTPEGDWRYGGNSPFSKEDMKNKKCPCIILAPPSATQKSLDPGYSDLLGSLDPEIVKIYFNDDLDIIKDRLKKFGAVELFECYVSKGD